MKDIDIQAENPFIMIADDDEDFLALISKKIKKRNDAIDINVVGDGEALINYLNQKPPYTDVNKEHKPDLILLDIKMPRKDGLSTLREIKQSEELSRIPIVMVSGIASEEIVQEALSLGANSFITKDKLMSQVDPLIQLLLNYWLDIVKDNKTPADTHNISQKLENIGDQNIWLIDDDEDYQNLVKKYLGDINDRLNLTSFESGEDFLYAIEHDSIRDDFTWPNLVLLDYRMPKMNGLEVLSRLRNHDVFMTLPVIIFSVDDNSETAREANRLGAKSYIRKPSNSADLKNLLETLLSYWFNLNK